MRQNASIVSFCREQRKKLQMSYECLDRLSGRTKNILNAFSGFSRAPKQASVILYLGGKTTRIKSNNSQVPFNGARTQAPDTENSVGSQRLPASSAR
jgi:hypothetical protein